MKQVYCLFNESGDSLSYFQYFEELREFIKHRPSQDYLVKVYVFQDTLSIKFLDGKIFIN